MPNPYLPSEVHAQGGRKILADRGFSQDMQVQGDVLAYGLTAAAGLNTFREAVRSVIVIATGGAVTIAKSAADLVKPMDGTGKNGPWLVPAGATREFPLWQDEVFVSGACYLEGRI